MNKKMKKIVLGLLCVLMLAIACGCNDKAQDEPTASDPSYQDTTIIATVNGVDITRGELNQRVDMLAASMTHQYQIELTKEDAPDFYDSLKDVAFEDLVLGILLDEDAEKEGFQIEDSQIEAYMQEVEEYASSLGQTLEEYVESLCATEADLEKEYQRNEFILEKQNQLIEQIEISDEEAQAYYDAHINDFTTPAGIQMAHILVATEEEANGLIAQLNEGADFAELAQSYSTDAGSAAQGGDLGIVNEDTNFVPEFKEAALALEPGEVTQTPVQSDYGWHIIQAGDRVEESVQPFDTAKTLIVYSLQNTKGQEALQNYAQELKERATIEDMREEEDKSQGLSLEDEGTEASPAEENDAPQETEQP